MRSIQLLEVVHRVSTRCNLCEGVCTDCAQTPASYCKWCGAAIGCTACMVAHITYVHHLKWAQWLRRV